MAYVGLTPYVSGNVPTAAQWIQFLDNLSSLRGFNSHFAQVEISEDFDIPNQTITTLTWDVVRKRRGSTLFSTGQPTRFNAPVAGQYGFIFECEWHNATGGERTIALLHNVPNTTYTLSSQGSAEGGGNQNGFQIISMAAGEWCTAYVYQAEGAPVKIRGAGRDRTSMTAWLMGVT